MGNNSELYQGLERELEKLNYNLNSLPNETKKHLLSIKAFCDEQIKVEKELHAQLSRHYVSKKSIANNTDVARQTLYNNEIIGKYVDMKITEFNKIDDSKKLAELAKNYEMVYKQLLAFAERDIEICDLRNENKKLRKLIKDMGLNPDLTM